MLSKRVVGRENRFLLQMFLFLSVAIGCVLLSGFAGNADASFSSADFQGTWLSQGLQSGAASGWTYGTISIDSSGNATGTVTNNAGASSAYSNTFRIDANGTVTVAADPSAHGAMSSSKNVIVLNHASNGSYYLQVLVKGGTSYTSSDIAAVWNCATLETGAGAGWSTSAITLPGATSLQTTGGDGTTAAYLYAWQVDSNGDVTAPNDNSTVHGAMSSDKNFMVAVFTDPVVGSYLLQVFAKRGSTYAAADMQAIWDRNDLASGKSSGGNPGLRYGMEGSEFIGFFTNIETDVNGVTLSDQYIAQIASDGTMTTNNNDLSLGAMSSNKNYIIWAYTTEGTKGTGYNLGIDMKGNPSACSFALSPINKYFGSYAATGTIDVVSIASSCSWTATSNSPSLMVTGGAPGTGLGLVDYSVSANASGSSQTGTLTIAGLTFPVTQLPATFSTQDFTDVNSSSFYFNYVESIYNAHITTGCSNIGGVLSYCPTNNVTRAQMAAFIIRSLYGENFTHTQTQFFTDEAPTDFFFAYIQKMKDLGITTGTSATTYSPSDFVTRQQMAAFLIRAVQVMNGESPEAFTCMGGVDCSTTTPYFTDVQPTNPDGSVNVYFKYVQKLKELGITTGTSATTYSPTDLVTRQQMAAFLSRAFLFIP